MFPTFTLALIVFQPSWLVQCWYVQGHPFLLVPCLLSSLTTAFVVPTSNCHGCSFFHLSLWSCLPRGTSIIIRTVSFLPSTTMSSFLRLLSWPQWIIQPPGLRHLTLVDPFWCLFILLITKSLLYEGRYFNRAPNAPLLKWRRPSVILLGHLSKTGCRSMLTWPLVLWDRHLTLLHTSYF